MLLFSGIGMILVGILISLYWQRKTKVGKSYFFWGAGIWVIAIAVKIAMDFTVTPLFSAYLQAYGLVAVLLGIGLYVGLRTGLFESGFSYLAILKTSLRKMNYKQGIAFGIGFGAIEALFLGITSFLNVLVFVMFPDIISFLPEAQQAAILLQLNASSWIIFVPIIERVATIFIHVFASILVLYAVKSRKIGYLVLSILYKTLVDGMIPWLAYSMQPLMELTNAYVVEIPIIILAIIGFFGIKWIRPKFKTELK